ncbi:MAG: purine-nucleoside phosphorylase [Vicinamibacterales bacterium]
MSDYASVWEAAGVIRGRVNRTPELAVVLGSGLSRFADCLDSAVSMPYADLPRWPRAAVEGHEGRLVVGDVRGKTVAVLSGRGHLYEGHAPHLLAMPIRVMALVGVRTLVLTNAAGGIRPDLEPGAIVIIEDHINLTGCNPLVGENDERFGPRFPDMTDVYSPRLRVLADEAAAALGLALHRGTYAGVLGPSYETPAEVRFLRSIGADMVGMSTVPEAIVARHMGLEVLGLSCIANAAAGLHEGPLAHAHVVETAHRAGVRIARLLEEIVARV